MVNPAILILHGGGAFGAYECGVYEALVPHLRNEGRQLGVVAGASSGALTSAVIARHSGEADGGAAALRAFWSSLTFPGIPLFSVDSHAGRWYGLLSSLLLGNPALYRPNLAAWSPLLAPWRFDFPLFDTEPMRRTLEKHFGRFEANPGKSPRLMVRAVEIESGIPVVFDSWQHTITVDHLLASAATPLLFPAREVQGVCYWDGETSSNTVLREALQAMQSTVGADANAWSVFMVDLFPMNGGLPRSDLASTYRLFCTAMGQRAAYDRVVSRIVDEHLGFVEEAFELARDLPPSRLRARIEEEHRRLRSEKRMRLDFVVVRRRDFPYDHVSREFDYSAERISALIDQGCDDARQAFASAASD